MKSRGHLLVPVLLFALAAGAGWLSRGVKKGTSDAMLGGSSKPAKTERTLRAGRIPPEVLERLAFIRNAGSADDRLRATIEVARTLLVKDLAAWYDAGWFDDMEDIQKEFFEQITHARWLAEDGAGFMAYCLKKDRECTWQVAGMWAERDPAAALAFAGGLSDQEQKRRLFIYMAKELGKADPQMIVSHLGEIAKGLGKDSEQYVLQMLDGVVARDIGLLESALAGMPPEFERAARMSLETARLRRDLASAVAGLQDMEDGIRYFSLCAGRDAKVLEAIGKNPELVPPGWLGAVVNSGPEELVATDPERWLTADLAAMGMSGESAVELRNAAWMRLAQDDPDRAIALLAAGGFSPDERREAVRCLVGTIPDKQKAEAWMASLEDEGEIEAARQRASESEFLAPLKIAPPAMLADLANDDVDMRLGAGRMSRWTRAQVAQFSRDFAQLPAEQRLAVARKLTGDGIPEGVPREVNAQAMGYMIGQPERETAGEGDPTTLAWCVSQAAADWGNRDPVAAGEWVKSLPPSEERLWAAANLAARWGEYDPTAARRWMAGLPEAERGKVERMARGEWEAAKEE